MIGDDALGNTIEPLPHLINGLLSTAKSESSPGWAIRLSGRSEKKRSGLRDAFCSAGGAGVRAIAACRVIDKG